MIILMVLLTSNVIYNLTYQLDYEFDNPNTFDIAIDSMDRILVLNSSTVNIFDSNGNFIKSFPYEGEYDDIEVDSNDRIIVTDINNHRINIFDSNGNFITKFGSFSYDALNHEDILEPISIAVDKNDRIFVVDKYSKIKIFSIAKRYAISLYEDNTISDKMIDINQSIVVRFDTDDSIEQVRFRWIDPYNIVYIDEQRIVDGVAYSRYAPNIKGEWRIEVEFDDRLIEDRINVGSTFILEIGIVMVIILGIGVASIYVMRRYI